VNDSPDDDLVIVAVDPRHVAARDALRQYLDEIVSRVAGISIDASHADDVDDYTEPGGRFLLVSRAGEVIGCGAVRSLAPAVGELKRMWIRPDARGAGAGSALLSRLIEESRALGHTRLLLDTNVTLVEALAMYRKHGFEPIEPYHDNPDATHFLGRSV
jgi:GNAT superfamily N-acetyltransferase